MKKLTGIRKYLALFTGMVNPGIFKLPIRFIYAILKTMNQEKLTSLNGVYHVNTHYAPFPSESFNTSLKFFSNVHKGIYTPLSVYFSLTNQCINKCIYCSNYKKGGDANLSTDQIIEMINQVQNAGALAIGFTGGEPLMRDDLEDIIASVSDKSYSILFTSGYSLTEQRVQKLKKNGLTIASVSIDSHEEDEHNARRGSTHAFSDALQAIDLFSKAEIYTTASAVMNNSMQSWQEIEKFADFCYEKGAHELRILREIPSGKVCDSINNFDYKKIENLQKKYNRNKNKITIMSLPHFESSQYSACNAGLFHMYVDALGNLCPCDFVQKSFGNLREEKFSEVYNRMKVNFPNNSPQCLSQRIARGEDYKNTGDSFHGLLESLTKKGKK